jgi:hypothetical protein
MIESCGRSKKSKFPHSQELWMFWNYGRKGLCHISRGRSDDYELRKIEGQLKETQKDNWKIFPIVCFAFREKWYIKEEGDRWGSTIVIIKIPLSTEMALTGR